MGCFGTDLSRVRRAVSSCPAPAPSWFIFNSLTLYFNVIALPPPAPLLSCLPQQILPRQGTTATTTTTWASTGVWDVGRSSFLGFAFFFLHIYIFDGCGCQVYFPGYILLFFLFSPLPLVLLLYIRHFAISISRTENCLHCAEEGSSGNRSSPANCSFKSVSEGCNKCSSSSSDSDPAEAIDLKGFH